MIFNSININRFKNFFKKRIYLKSQILKLKFVLIYISTNHISKKWNMKFNIILKACLFIFLITACHNKNKSDIKRTLNKEERKPLSDINNDIDQLNSVKQETKKTESINNGGLLNPDTAKSFSNEIIPKKIENNQDINILDSNNRNRKVFNHEINNQQILPDKKHEYNAEITSSKNQKSGNTKYEISTIILKNTSTTKAKEENIDETEVKPIRKNYSKFLLEKLGKEPIDKEYKLQLKTQIFSIFSKNSLINTISIYKPGDILNRSAFLELLVSYLQSKDSVPILTLIWDNILKPLQNNGERMGEKLKKGFINNSANFLDTFFSDQLFETKNTIIDNALSNPKQNYYDTIYEEISSTEVDQRTHLEIILEHIVKENSIDKKQEYISVLKDYLAKHTKNIIIELIEDLKFNVENKNNIKIINKIFSNKSISNEFLFQNLPLHLCNTKEFSCTICLETFKSNDITLTCIGTSQSDDDYASKHIYHQHCIYKNIVSNYCNSQVVSLSDKIFECPCCRKTDKWILKKKKTIKKKKRKNSISEYISKKYNDLKNRNLITLRFDDDYDSASESYDGDWSYRTHTVNNNK